MSQVRQELLKPREEVGMFSVFSLLPLCVGRKVEGDSIRVEDSGHEVEPAVPFRMF